MKSSATTGLLRVFYQRILHLFLKGRAGPTGGELDIKRSKTAREVPVTTRTKANAPTDTHERLRTKEHVQVNKFTHTRTLYRVPFNPFAAQKTSKQMSHAPVIPVVIDTPPAPRGGGGGGANHTVIIRL